MTNPLNLSKKTKAEIIEEYNKLINHAEEAKMTAKLIHDQPNIDLLTRARGYSIDSVQQAMTRLKSDLDTSLNELINKTEAELKKFEELQQAIEISKKTLENQYHLQITAESLELLLRDYQNKSQQLGEEYSKKGIELENEIITKKVNWSREQEEYEYNMKLRLSRDQQNFAEEKNKREKIWQERETLIKNQEEEINKIREEAANLPEKINKEVLIKEKEITERLKNEGQYKLVQEQKDWWTKEQIYLIKIDNLTSQIKRQELEIINLKKEQESANKKAQEMAIKIIEGSSVKIKTAEEQLKTI